MVASLDTLDFNLIVKEEDINKTDFSVDWKSLFADGSIDYKLLQPSLRPLPIYDSVSLNRTASSELKQLAVLADENARLRKSLVMQINQRAYFQNEYTKSQRKCAQLLEETFQAKEERTRLKKQVKELSFLVETHEETNQALQRQLSAAFEASEKEQLGQMNDSIVKLEEKLQQASIIQNTLEQQNEVLRIEREQLESRSTMQIKAMVTRMQEKEDSWMERVRVLQDQLQMANDLKEEYKKRLRDR